jgi:hypothetical protein
MTAPIITFRDTLKAISPPWLQQGYAWRILYALAVPIDAAGDALNAGIKLRFPNLYSGESLPYIGRERRIRRGLVETDVNYAARLRRWFEDHRRRGGPYALLEQLYAHYAPNNFRIDLWYASGRRFVMDPDGTITSDIPALPDDAYWSRWTLIYFTDDYTIADAVDLAIIPREWIAAHCLGLLVVLPTGGRLWDYPPERTWNSSDTWNSADATATIPIVSA